MYINYGDYNFFEYGVLVDSEHSDTEINILYCRPYDDTENEYLFADCTVDITNSWINKDSVMNYIGMTEKNFDKIQYAIGCIEYYGTENFKDYYRSMDNATREEIEEQLKHYLIASDNLDITW